MFTSLGCGTGTTVGVDAFDLAGNRSSRRPTTVSTSRMSGSQPAQRPDGSQAGGRDGDVGGAVLAGVH